MPHCHHCRKAPIPAGHHRYCRTCSPLASKLWKTAHRRCWSQLWRQEGCRGPAPYLDGWESREAYQAYYRAYMRAWRRRRRTLAAKAERATAPGDRRAA